MKRIRRLAKPNGYASTVSRHLRRLSSGSASGSNSATPTNRRSGAQAPLPEEASVASLQDDSCATGTSISVNSSCNTDRSDVDGIGNDGDAHQDREGEQLLRKDGHGNSTRPQPSQSLCLHVIEEQNIDVPQLCQAWGEFQVILQYMPILHVAFRLFGD